MHPSHACHHALPTDPWAQHAQHAAVAAGWHMPQQHMAVPHAVPHYSMAAHPAGAMHPAAGMHQGGGMHQMCHHQPWCDMPHVQQAGRMPMYPYQQMHHQLAAHYPEHMQLPPRTVAGQPLVANGVPYGPPSDAQPSAHPYGWGCHGTPQRLGAEHQAHPAQAWMGQPPMYGARMPVSGHLAIATPNRPL
jgi:hypothetical protein